MRNVEIAVFQIARSQVEEPTMRDWLDFIGADEYDIPPSDEITDRELLVGVAAKRCYMSFEVGLNPNVTKVRKDWTDYLDNILKSGHGSVLEHASYTYAIENVSRVFTGEMNRHRAGTAISEGSMRYIRFTDIPFWMPLSLRYNKDEEDSLALKKKIQSQEIFREVFTFCQDKYTELVELWDMDNPEAKFAAKKQITSCLRRIIPMGVATGGIWTFNIRALRHVLAIRSTPHAEEEIAHVMSLIGKDIVEKEPRLFGDFKQDEQGFWVPQYEKV